MERRLKERLIGAAVLVMLAVIFIPMVLDDSIQDENEITGTNIPERPDIGSDAGIIPAPASDIKQIPPLLSDEVESEIIEDADKKTDEPHTQTQETVAEVKSGKADIAVPHDKETQKTAVATEKAPVTAPVDTPVQPESGQKGLTAWVVQLGSFSSQENADSLSEKLRNAGYPAFVEPVKTGPDTVYRVRVGPELLRSDAQALQNKLDKEFQQKGIVLRYP